VSDRLLTAGEVAELLNVPIGWVRAHTRAGNVPHVMLGRYPRYRESDLRAWLESLTEGGGPAFRRHRPRLVS
jgi:excisionase family DNA binding protein